MFKRSRDTNARYLYSDIIYHTFIICLKLEFSEPTASLIL